MPPQTPPQMNNTKATPNPTGSMGSAMPQAPHAKKPVGPIVGAVIIVLVFVLGGLYFWGEKLNRETRETPEEIMATPDTTTENLKVQGSSDTVSDIEADLNATEINNLDQEIGNIETNLAQ